MDHHYVPIFYTSNWINKNGKILYYKFVHINKIVCGEITPENTGFEPDLYAKENTTDDDKHSIEEKCYKEIDDKGAKSLSKITYGEINKLSDNDKMDWSRFVVSMMTRHKDMVKNATQLGKEIIHKKTKLLSAEEQVIFQPVIAYWYENIGKETLAAMATSHHMPNMDSLEKYTGTLLKMHWWVEDFSKTSFSLLTSDYPVTFHAWGDRYVRMPTLNDMLLTGHFILAMPLSPKICFYACMRKSRFPVTQDALIKIQNRVTIAKAKNFVFTNDMTQDYFIRRRFRQV